MVKMQRYKTELIYTLGKPLILADALSRAPTKCYVSANKLDVQMHINILSAMLPVSDTKTKQIVNETVKDPELQHLMNKHAEWMGCRIPTMVLPHQR